MFLDHFFFFFFLPCPACISFLQRVFAKKPSICYHPPPRRKGRVEIKVDQQTKRSPKQILSLLAFTCISNGISLIPTKRWFSLDHLSLTVSQCFRRAERSRRGLVEVRGKLASVSGGMITFFYKPIFLGMETVC